MGFFKSTPAKTKQFSNFSKDQEGAFNQILGGSQGQLGGLFSFLNNILGQSPEALSAFEAPTRRAFEQQTIPSIAERFSKYNAQGSSAFGQRLGQAGRELEEGLAAQRSGLGMQAANQLQNLLGIGLTPQKENVYMPNQPSGLMNMLQQLIPAAGMAAGSYFGGPAGAAAGGALGAGLTGKNNAGEEQAKIVQNPNLSRQRMGTRYQNWPSGAGSGLAGTIGLTGGR